MPRTGRPKSKLELTDDERDQLQRWTRRHTSTQALALRARIILACAEGTGNREVAHQLGCHEVTVGNGGLGSCPTAWMASVMNNAPAGRLR